MDRVLETTAVNSDQPLPGRRPPILTPRKLRPEDMGVELASLIPAPEPSVKPCSIPGDREANARTIPVCTPTLNGKEREYVTDCLNSNWISSIGPMVRKFELAFAQACDAKHAIACCNGTAALHLALASLALGPSDEVILPAFTMVATINAVTYTGARPILVDADPASWNLNIDHLQACITPNTRAILPVHIYGVPCDMLAINALADKHGVWVVEDAAEAMGARHHGHPVGSLGDVATFSLYANKLITSGEGGVVTTNNPELATVIRTLRDHAFSSERHFWHQFIGFNYRMTSLQAAIALAQVEQLATFLEARINNAAAYRSRLQSVPGIRFQALPEALQSSFWMNAIVVEPEFGHTRDQLRQYLADRGIETRCMFIPMHMQPIYFAQFRPQRFPVAETLCSSGLYLPSSSSLSLSDIDYICNTIKQCHQGPPSH